MYRFIAVALALAACNTQPDRPETADYIIVSILEPYCGRGGCHTIDTQPHGLAFDTIPNSLAAMRSSQRGEVLVVPGDPQRSRLVTILTDSSRIMPPDQPLQDADIELISNWVADGADGL